MEVGFAFEPPYGAWHRAASDHGQGLEGGLGHHSMIPTGSRGGD
jgi:hypothetical protein